MPPQLLLHNVVPVPHGLFQPLEAGAGEELGGGKRGQLPGGKPVPHPLPGARVSGLHLLTLRKGRMSKIWMDQWSQVFIKSWTQPWMTWTKVSSCRKSGPFQFRTRRGQGGAEGWVQAQVSRREP